ncbi:DEAD/DEAH box helicase family protein, partial [Listeria monocytogenes]|uniref:DEAD/DEAH box helicase family protein n=1 Tax=Listeria monocytogenes TaxID=1639 RepID=UPI002FDC77A2
MSRVTYDPAAQIVPLERLSGTLRDYQIEAVEVCAQKRQGIVVLACGGGKTRVGSALVIYL